MEKLTDDELNQLKMLLIRYLAYHAQGVFNMAVDALIAKFRANPRMIDVTPVPELPAPAPNPKKRQARAAKAS
jgi:hypothetical protein